MNELRADSSHHEGREDKGYKTILSVATAITRGKFRYLRLILSPVQIIILMGVLFLTSLEPQRAQYLV